MAGWDQRAGARERRAGAGVCGCSWAKASEVDVIGSPGFTDRALNEQQAQGRFVRNEARDFSHQQADDE